MDTTPTNKIVVHCDDDNRRRGDYNGDGLLGDLHILNALNDIHGDVKDAECSVKDSIMVSNSQRQTAELNLHNRLCEAEKAAIDAKWAGITQTKNSEASLMARIEECCCDMKVQNLELKNYIGEKFCDLERRELNRELTELRDEKVDGTNASLLAAINALAAKIVK